MIDIYIDIYNTCNHIPGDCVSDACSQVQIFGANRKEQIKENSIHYVQLMQESNT